MNSGKVKWFNDEKGYGFITPDDGGNDVFLHHSALPGKGRKTIVVGEKVSFTIEKGARGPQAGNVKVIS